MMTRLLFAERTNGPQPRVLLAVDDVDGGLGTMWGDIRDENEVSNILELDGAYWGLWVYDVEFDERWADQAPNWNYLKGGTIRRLTNEELLGMRCGGLPWKGEWV